MEPWIAVAGVGGLLTLAGWRSLCRRFRDGRITLLNLLAHVIGFGSFVSYAVITATRPDLVAGPVALAVLLPAFAAIVVLVLEFRKAGGTGRTGR